MNTPSESTRFSVNLNGYKIELALQGDMEDDVAYNGYIYNYLYISAYNL